MTSAALHSVPSNGDWEPGPGEILLGVDIIELVSSSMYVEPLTAYREYVQNAADAIDDARAAGVLLSGAHGRIDLTLDVARRTVTVRDNGIGVAGSEFLRRLTAFGASDKRARDRRGFRGVGRLAALGYCQELLFRSRTAPDEPVRELRWDCRELRHLLRSGAYEGSLVDAVRRTTTHRVRGGSGFPQRFFEVELRSVVRHGRDDLLNEAVVRAYLSQVAPVPFSSSFRYREEIEGFLSEVVSTPALHIYVNGEGPLERPYRNAIPIRSTARSLARELTLLTIPSLEGGSPAAKGWILHHDYLGAIPRELGVRGLRLRRGNIQVGDDATLNDLFSEPRFNSWSIGELHIFDRRIVPNGRRDQFEQNAHFANVLNHLAPSAREIAGRCRSQSLYRQRLRNADLFEEKIKDSLEVLRQGAVSATARRVLIGKLQHTLARFAHLAEAAMLAPDDRKKLALRLKDLRKRVKRAAAGTRGPKSLVRLNEHKRRAYTEVFSLIFECASDLRGARELVSKVLARLDEQGRHPRARRPLDQGRPDAPHPTGPRPSKMKRSV